MADEADLQPDLRSTDSSHANRFLETVRRAVTTPKPGKPKPEDQIKKPKDPPKTTP